MICTTFIVRAFAQPDGVLRVLDRDDRPAGCPPWCRVFVITDVPKHERRGGHAHRRCHQTFVMLRGSCWLSISTPDGDRYEAELSHHAGVWVPPWRWCDLRGFSRDAVLMVLASEPYDPADYIEDPDEFAAGVEVGP